ncbi:unnamed protein product [Adineta steineri]|uniref:Uncharacterized protein n=1 Tax=Adineta steineri TaxID=433720 RepID=A0A814QYT4_9BILA|nr:unnamed protein product [Adineta steineri]CAF3718998.1 unnamed protein product [Adineta steineri]
MHSLYYRGYGQVRELYLEDNQMGDPSLVLQAPNITISRTDIIKNFQKALNLFANEGIRKRFMVINFSKGTYIIGGYVYIPNKYQRQIPNYDYFYDSNLDRLIPIEPLPDGRVSFAICSDGRYIICAGGHTYMNVALKSVYMFDTEESIWIRLPDLPAPTSGAGIAFHKDSIHLLGGFDIILNRSVVHGEYIVLNLKNTDENWIRRTEIVPGRARPLLLIVPDPHNPNETAIYSAGGYDIDSSHKPHSVTRLEYYNERFERWEFMDTIENLQLEYGLSYANNKLNVMANDIRLQQYDFRTRKWTKSIVNNVLKKNNNSLL